MYTCTYVSTYVHTCVCMYVCICMYVYIYIYMHLWTLIIQVSGTSYTVVNQRPSEDQTSYTVCIFYT